jgi:trimeric autotransporter adhesin
MNKLNKTLSAVLTFMLTLGIGYAAWDSNKTTGDPLLSTDWNNMVNQVKGWTRSSTLNTSDVYLGTTGNVGIGTTSPEVALHINGSGYTETRIEAGTDSALTLKYNVANTGGLFFNNGSAVASIYGDANANLVVKTNTAKPINFQINSVEKMRIDSTGNVGIGTISPSTALEVVGIITSQNLSLDGTTSFIGANTSDASDNALVTIGGGGADSDSRGAKIRLYGNEHANTGQLVIVAGNVSGNSIQFQTSAAEVMRIDSSGNVGIGTASPTSELHIVNSGTVSERIESSDNGNTDLTLDSGTQGEWTIQTGPSVGLSLRFYDQANAKERMRIASSGNVGIGTESPLTTLHVKQSDSGITTPDTNADEFMIENSANAGMTIASGISNFGLLYFGDSGDSSIGGIKYNHSNNSMAFRTNASNNMTIDSAGNVGIGTTTPATTLQVNSNEAAQTYFTTAQKGIFAGGSSDLSEGLALWHRGNGDDYIGSQYDSDTSALHFVNRSSSSTNNIVAMTLKDGKVGIGTISPGSKLSVVGLPSGTTDSAATGSLAGAVCITDAGNMYIDTDGTCAN